MDRQGGNPEAYKECPHTLTLYAADGISKIGETRAQQDDWIWDEAGLEAINVRNSEIKPMSE